MAEEDVDYRQEILRVAAQDTAAFLTKPIDSDVTGIPPPPVIELTEVTADPIKFDFLGFGKQAAETTPSGAAPPGGGGVPPTCVLGQRAFCDPASAFLAKCGFNEYVVANPAKPKKFLTKTTSYNLNVHTTAEDCSVHPLCDTQVLDATEYWQKTETYDHTTRTPPSNTCPYDCNLDQCTGVNTGDYDVGCGSPPCGITPFPVAPCNCDWTLGFTGCPTLYDNCVQAQITVNSSGSTYTSQQKTMHDVVIPNCNAPGGIGNHCSGGSMYLEQLTDEYTNQMLEDDVLDMLPDFSGFYGEWSGCSAYKYRSDNEQTLSIGRFRYKIVFGSPSFPCLVKWHEVEYDENGALVVSVARQFLATVGVTETPVYQVDEPTTDNHYINLEIP